MNRPVKRAVEKNTQITVLVSVAVGIILFLFGFQAFYAAPVEIISLTVNKTVVEEPSPEKILNINTASREELCGLPGIGEVLSGRIVEYRQENGGFADIYELMNVKGISQTLFLKLKNQIEA